MRFKQLVVTIALFSAVFLAHATSPTLKDIQGNTIAFDTLKGKWVFINFWASWCQPCIEEIATFNRFYQAKKANVALFAVNYESLSLKEQQDLIKKLHIHYPSLENPAKQLHLKDVSGVPTTFVYDPNGHLSTILYGPQTIRRLNQVIQGKKTAS